MQGASDGRSAEKARLRSRFLAARAALSDSERAASSTAVCRVLAELPELQAARAVGGYAAFGTEVNIDTYLQGLLEQGKGLFLPWVDHEGIGIARVRDLAADLAPGWRGVREPRASGRRPARPDRLDAAVLPGVAFDRRGNRLGYGGGHFDRLVGALSGDAVAVGVCFATQLAEHLPTEPHDSPVDVIITEREVVRPR